MEQGKSLQLLRDYGGAEGYESESADEHTDKSRARRLRVAKCIGVTNTQLNFAQLTL